MTPKKNQSGFTLIELMIVVTIIAILAAIAIPSYLGIQKKARRSEAKAHLPGIAMALENFHAENGNYGAANIYTYITVGGTVVGTFGHGGNLADVVNLGNELEYDYQIIITQPQTAFTVLAIPKEPSELTPWLQSDGQKGPAGFGW